jgi:surface antigen
MRTKRYLTVLLAGLMAATAIEPVAAQPGRFGNPPLPPPQARGNPAYDRGYEQGYNDAYRQGYRAGYDDGRSRRRYDDTDYSYGYGYDYGNRNLSREQLWQRRYNRNYTYNDDVFYQECRQSVDPAGVIAGALIGGILGNAVGRGGARGGTTVAGVIVGGALGAALTRNLDCDDRSYAYKTYYDGFNAGRPNARYQWRNPRSGHYGDFMVQDYYDDPDGFRCANYTQQIFINGRPQAASGRACQQPDGTWAIVS